MINWQLSKQGIRWPDLITDLITSWAQVSTPSRSGIFMKLSADKLIVFKWSQAQFHCFKKFIWNVLCLLLHNLNFDFKLTSDAKSQPAITGREDSCFWLFSQWSRVGHALRPIFMPWLVKIWQVSSCGKFMQHHESCLLWQLKKTEFCVNLFVCCFFNCLFPLDVMYKNNFSCYHESSVIDG